MKKIWSMLKRFFFPPSGSSVWLRILPFAVLGILTIFVLSGAAYTWEYTNSSEFCGTACHTMPPEYSAYLRSPHARVQCVECHIGRDILTTRFSRKAGDIRHILLMVSQSYEFPIHTQNMRPARDSCERCHFPEKFSDDSLREIRHYGNDDQNSVENVYLILKTGGGSKREGLGRGIHWHIENEVWYLPTDDLQQDIPYVRVVDENGVEAEYYDIGSGYTPELVAGSNLVRMDCITCHNRITHSMPHPEEAIDQALAKGILPSDLPAIRRQAVSLLGVLYLSDQEAEDAINSLEDFYQENYPAVYQERADDITHAIDTLQELYGQMVFRDQKIDWDTHPNNLGHKYDPGCFRCHDGKHLTQTGEAIRLECNLCHSIPVMGDPNSLTTSIELVSGPEPASHTHTSWITLHGKAIDSTCIACHAPNDPSVILDKLDGKPPEDGSFCGNSACHSTEWRFSGFNNPALAPVLDRQLYALLNTSPYLTAGLPPTYANGFQAVFDGRCIACHSGPEPKAGLDLSSYQTILLGGNSGPGITPGDPGASQIYLRQTSKPAHFGQMVRDEIDALEAWILAGAPEE